MTARDDADLRAYGVHLRNGRPISMASTARSAGRICICLRARSPINLSPWQQERR